MAIQVVLIGVGATVCIDLWALLLRRLFGVRSLDYCLLGRWVLHMPLGRIAHESIAAASRRPHECKVGWTAHYSIGVVFAGIFVAMTSGTWLQRPSFLPAVAFGLATVAVPFLAMQPAFGLGIAAARTQNPWAARARSLMTHAVFGAGLYGYPPHR